ncbi:MAG: hypothetical protein HRT42_09240 [Campylobacteraceae bacterium]|nr:hypothetical protein [Campylobacteraceae bacterium]
MYSHFTTTLNVYKKNKLSVMAYSNGEALPQIIYKEFTSKVMFKRLEVLSSEGKTNSNKLFSIKSLLLIKV